MAHEFKTGDTVWIKTEVGRVEPDWIETDTDSGKGFFREDWDEYIRVVAPAPTDTLRAAAQELLDVEDETERRWRSKEPVLFQHSMEFREKRIAALAALRAALDAPPVALTAEDRSELIIAATEGRHYAGLMGDAVDAVLAKLNDLGYAIVRRTA